MNFGARFLWNYTCFNKDPCGIDKATKNAF